VVRECGNSASTDDGPGREEEDVEENVAIAEDSEAVLNTGGNC
jgi:hypothetical protein